MDKPKLSRWKFNHKKKIIYLDKETFFEKIIGFFGFPKYEMIDFYRYVKSREDDEDLIVRSDPIKKDGKEGSSTQYPRFTLENDWKIKKDNLRHLKNGPLISQNDITLVTRYTFWERSRKTIKTILEKVFLTKVMSLFS